MEPSVKQTVKETVKFATRSYAGGKVDCYLVEGREPPKPVAERQIGHLILVLDRSGSMYGTRIDEAKWAIERILTLESFFDPDTRVTLYSYASDGDIECHWSYWPVSKLGLDQMGYVRNLEAGGLTCATQAFDEAIGSIGDELTAIVFHTDGWFNDPNPTDERKGIRNIIEQLRPRQNVVVNTIAYGEADFGLLSEISNALSGKCIQTNDIKVMYEAIKDTAKLVMGRFCPAIVLSDEDDYKTAVNVTQRKVNGAAATLSIRGFTPEDNLTTYHYRKVTEAEYDAAEAPEVHNHPAVYAFARAKLAEGNLNAAKYALVATRDRGLIEAHAKALTAGQLLALAMGLEGRLYEAQATDFQDEYGVGTARISVTEVASLLQAHKGFRVHLDRMLPTYQRRGLRRLQGVWGPEGFIPAAYAAAARRIEEPLEAEFEYNNENATLNMTVSIPAVLRKSATGEEVRSVAGHSLDDFTLYRSYTLVGDGNVNVDVLPITISDKRLHAALVAGGALPATPYSHKEVYEIDLHQHPLVPFRPLPLPTSADIRRLAYLRAIRSVFKATVDDEAVAAVAWSEEQVAELKEHCLTRTLGFNPPTTLPYRDAQDGIRTGLADSRVSYEVAVGSGNASAPGLALPVLSDMPSANEAFGRYFVAIQQGTPLVAVEVDNAGKAKKAKLSLLRKGFRGEAKDAKALARVKRKAFDGIFNDVLSPLIDKSEPAAEVAAALEAAGVALTPALFDLSSPDFDTTAAEAVTSLDREIERMYATLIRPIVFFIGASGLVPDEWSGATMLTEEEVGKVAVDASGGNFVWLKGPDLLVSIRTKVAHYSTAEGLAAADKLQAPETV